jgi:hypothetical protein
MFALRLHSILFALALVSASNVAIAAPNAKDKAAAKSLANDGRKALKDNRWADAMTALAQADKLDPSAAVEVDLAKAQIGAGKLIEAQQTLTAAVADETDGSPAARRARDAAQKALAGLMPRIPTVTIKVKAGSDDGPKPHLTVDGVEIDSHGDAQVNPGTHAIGASAEGYVSAEKELQFREGAHEKVTLTLTPKPAQNDQAKAAPEKSAGSRVPGAVVTVIGGAGLVVGGVFGGLAFSHANAAKSQCVNNVCPLGAASDIATSTKDGNISTGVFVGAGIVTAVGIVLLIVAPGGSKSEPKSDDAKSARLTPWVGLGSAGLGATGAF